MVWAWAVIYVGQQTLGHDAWFRSRGHAVPYQRFGHVKTRNGRRNRQLCDSAFQVRVLVSPRAPADRAVRRSS